MSIVEKGDRVPHFTVSRLDGSKAEYAASTWQHRNLLLVTLPAARTGDATERLAAAAAAYADEVGSRAAQWAALETDVVITTDRIAGVPSPGVVIADRWGEIQAAWHEPTPDRLPPADELVEWLRYIQQVCPECQGEAY
jgi:hypothetical protein